MKDMQLPVPFFDITREVDKLVYTISRGMKFHPWQPLRVKENCLGSQAVLQSLSKIIVPTLIFYRLPV